MKKLLQFSESLSTLLYYNMAAKWDSIASRTFYSSVHPPPPKHWIINQTDQTTTSNFWTHRRLWLGLPYLMLQNFSSFQSVDIYLKILLQFTSLLATRYFFLKCQSVSWSRNSPFYGNRIFVIVLNCTLTWATWIQSRPSHRISRKSVQLRCLLSHVNFYAWGGQPHAQPQSCMTTPWMLTAT